MTSPTSSRSLAQDVLQSSLAHGALTALSFIGSLLLAEALGPSDRGMLAQFTSWITLAAVLAMLGLNIEVRRLAAIAPHLLITTLSQSGRIITVTSTGIAVFALFGWTLLQPVAGLSMLTLLILLMTLPAMAIGYTWEEAFVGTGRSTVYDFANALQRLTALFAVSCFWLSDTLSVNIALAVTCVSFWLKIAFIGLSARRTRTQTRRSLPPPPLTIKPQTGHYACAILTATTNATIATALALLSTPSEAGFYAFAALVVTNLRIPLNFISIHITSRLIDAKETGTFEATLTKACIATILSATILAIPSAIVVPKLLLLFVGSSFEPSIPVLYILLVAFVVGSLGLILQARTTAAETSFWAVATPQFVGFVTLIAIFLPYAAQGGAIWAATSLVVSSATTTAAAVIGYFRSSV